MDMNRFVEMKENLLQSADHFPEVAILVPVLCIIVGFILWMIGARLVRVAATISSIAICGLLGAIVGRILDGGVFAVVLVVFGAAVGGVLGWMAFRGVMAAAGATVITALVPMFYIFFGNMQPPPVVDEMIQKVAKKAGIETKTNEERLEIQENAAEKAIKQLNLVPEEFAPKMEEALSPEPDQLIAMQEENPENFGEEGHLESTEELGWQEQIAGRINLAIDAFVQLQQKYQSALSTWWEEVTPAQRSGLVIGMIIAFICGGLLGFLLPHLTASGLTAITGSLMVFIGIDALLVFYAVEQADKMHQHPRAVIIAFAVMSALGGLIQWKFRVLKKPE